MKKDLRLLLSASLMVMALGFTSCKGDQGEVGPAGTSGTTGSTGATGTAGAKGDKGDQGEGFSEATSFGNILVTVNGKTYDDVAYSKTLDFKYILDYNSVSGSSSYYYNNDVLTFDLDRQFKNSASNARTEESGNNTIEFSGRVENGQIIVQYFNISSEFIHDGKILHTHSNYYVYNEDNEGKSFEFTNYSFDATTHSLKFNFTYTDGEKTISGKVDTKVFESTYID